MSKILFLGGSFMQLSAINYAKSENHHTICADYLKESPGHNVADESFLISTTNKEEIFDLAKSKEVDAVIAYASDPAAATASYVSEKLGLVGNPHESVKTLSVKSKFRKFLRDNNFNTPKFIESDNFDQIQDFYFGEKIVIKPVDSSGSKGVTVIQHKRDIEDAFKHAMSYSRSEKVIAEEFVSKSGYQIAGDGFVYNKKLVFRCFANEHFNRTGNILVPIGESFPYVEDNTIGDKVHSEVQRLVTLLNIKIGALNFDIRIKDNEVYLMEVGPRNGGNFIPEIIKYATGIDLIKYTVDAHLGYDCSDLSMKGTNGFFSSYMVHSSDEGILKEIRIDKKIKNNIIKFEQWLSVGDKVDAFSNASKLVGIMILKFETMGEMLEKMDNMSLLIKVKLDI